MSWTKNTPMYHRADTQHTFRQRGITLVTEKDGSGARVSKENMGQRYSNAINLDRSEINTVIELLRAWRDAV